MKGLIKDEFFGALFLIGTLAMMGVANYAVDQAQIKSENEVEASTLVPSVTNVFWTEEDQNLLDKWVEKERKWEKNHPEHYQMLEKLGL